MSTPLSFCDISARFGQAPAPQQSIGEQSGWNLSQTFLNYMLKLRRQQKEDAEDAEEDALMAVIDAMTASEEDIESGRLEQTLTRSLAKAGRAITEQHEKVLEDGTRRVEWVDPAQSLTIQVLLSCAGDRIIFEQADEIRENTEEALEHAEQEAEEESLNVTEKRELSDPSDPDNNKKEV